MSLFRAAAVALLATLSAGGSEDGSVVIPAGEFTMGRTELNSDDEHGMRPLIVRDDRPPHAVWIDEFRLDAREVTQDEYAEFVAATGRTPPRHWPGGEVPQDSGDFPAYNVDWRDAAAYCEWKGGRLPTEAEWEKAARGGLEGKEYPWGDAKPDDRNVRFDTPLGPGPVGRYEPNGYGLYDMAGGVSEWCVDWFERTYYERSPERNPQGPDQGRYKIIRGGAWSDKAIRLRVYFRNWVRPDQKTPNIGFRCAR